MTRPDALPGVREAAGKWVDATVAASHKANEKNLLAMIEAEGAFNRALATHTQAAVREAVAKVHVSRAEWDELLDRLTWRDEHGDQHAVTDVANAFLNRCTVTEEASRGE